MNLTKSTSAAYSPKKPLIHIFFDVDSTLSGIEGIDVLAEWNQVGKEVSSITKECMSVTGMNPGAYRQRMQMVAPTLTQVKKLSKLYLDCLTPGAFELVSILQKFDKRIYIVSAGIRQALSPLAIHLGIPVQNIYAVDVFFDDNGYYRRFDKASPLTQNEGKRFVIEKLCPANESSLLIGDGLSNLDARSAVTRFVGFGGHQMRQTIKKASDFYISTSNLLALLPLVLTAAEVKKLNQEERTLYNQGLIAIHHNQISF